MAKFNAIKDTLKVGYDLATKRIKVYSTAPTKTIVSKIDDDSILDFRCKSDEVHVIQALATLVQYQILRSAFVETTLSQAIMSGISDSYPTLEITHHDSGWLII